MKNELDFEVLRQVWDDEQAQLRQKPGTSESIIRKCVRREKERRRRRVVCFCGILVVGCALVAFLSLRNNVSGGLPQVDYASLSVQNIDAEEEPVLDATSPLLLTPREVMVARVEPESVQPVEGDEHALQEPEPVIVAEQVPVKRVDTLLCDTVTQRRIPSTHRRFRKIPDNSASVNRSLPEHDAPYRCIGEPQHPKSKADYNSNSKSPSFNEFFHD